MRNLLRHCWLLPRKVVVAMIVLYQSTLSPDHGPLRALFPMGYCPHEPTCSDFGKKMIAERGVLIGTPLLLWRLLHCHPWTRVSDAKIRATLLR